MGWNEEVKEAVLRKKDSYKAMSRNSAEDNKNMRVKQRKQFQKQ